MALAVSDYISEAGYQALQDEREHLYRVERPKVVANVLPLQRRRPQRKCGVHYCKKRLRN